MFTFFHIFFDTENGFMLLVVMLCETKLWSSTLLWNIKLNIVFWYNLQLESCRKNHGKLISETKKNELLKRSLPHAAKLKQQRSWNFFFNKEAETIEKKKGENLEKLTLNEIIFWKLTPCLISFENYTSLSVKWLHYPILMFIVI